MATRRITAAFVQSLNHQVSHGGVVVKPNELESAMARPLWKKHYNPQTPPSELAAALAFGIIQDHPFMDGNKRTAFWAANEYLKDIGAPSFSSGTIENTSTEVAMQAINDAHEKVASGKMDEAGLAEAYKQVLGK